MYIINYKTFLPIFRAGGEQIIQETTEIMPNGVLMFKSVTGQESGSYVCTATNGMGTITATATLNIQGKYLGHTRADVQIGDRTGILKLRVYSHLRDGDDYRHGNA